MKQVLFLCSANYYRSRFAEHLFNWLACQAKLSWHAESRGLVVARWPDLRAMSHYTVEGLKQRGIAVHGLPRNPQPITVADLTNSDLVVAVKEAEHRRMMAEQFPLWTDLVEYWHIDDLDCAEAGDALPCLEAKVEELVARLLCRQAA